MIRPVFFMESFFLPDFQKGIAQGMLAMGIRPETRLQSISIADIEKTSAEFDIRPTRFREWAMQQDWG